MKQIQLYHLGFLQELLPENFFLEGCSIVKRGEVDPNEWMAHRSFLLPKPPLQLLQKLDAREWVEIE